MDKIYMKCPLCNFDVVYVDAENKKVADVFSNGEIDTDTIERDLSHSPEDITGIYCNHINCGQKIEIAKVDEV